MMVSKKVLNILRIISILAILAFIFPFSALEQKSESKGLYIDFNTDNVPSLLPSSLFGPEGPLKETLPPIKTETISANTAENCYFVYYFQDIQTDEKVKEEINKRIKDQNLDQMINQVCNGSVERKVKLKDVATTLSGHAHVGQFFHFCTEPSAQCPLILAGSGERFCYWGFCAFGLEKQKFNVLLLIGCFKTGTKIYEGGPLLTRLGYVYPGNRDYNPLAGTDNCKEKDPVHGCSYMKCYTGGLWGPPEPIYDIGEGPCSLNPLFQHYVTPNELETKGTPTAIGCFPSTTKGVIIAILRIFMGISGLIALGVIISSIIVIMTQPDNPQKIKDAYSRITYAAIGLIVIILAVFLLRFIGISILNLPQFGGGKLFTVGG